MFQISSCSIGLGMRASCLGWAGNLELGDFELGFFLVPLFSFSPFNVSLSYRS